MHSGVGCTHAPRPGRTALSSTMRVSFWFTTLRRVEREARARQPTHVRTGSILHLGFVSRSPIRGAPTRLTDDQSSTLSGWMSIFAPVNLAARRAFWPSLPMASDSW